MPLPKIYKCCICHKVLDIKPHRLVHQEYISHLGGYGRYMNKSNYDFCSNCFSTYINWIIRYKEE